MHTNSIDNRFQYKGIHIPPLIYGTAWKEGGTEALTRMALRTGFRGIDTANQPRHYNEPAVGQAITEALRGGDLQRRDLFIQTKFTYPAGQDHRMPYDAAAPAAEQVKQSLTRSLSHLQTDYVDALILHGPSVPHGWGGTDWEVWRTMEAMQHGGKVRMLGVSNIDRDQLALLLDKAEIKPAIVQNRCFARKRWDYEVRVLCRSNGIIYQGFSLLTANVAEINTPMIGKIAERTGSTRAQVVFAFALQSGMVSLTGTTQQRHMRQDLAAHEIELNEEEVWTIEQIAVL